MVKKGQWVRIRQEILSPEERAPQIPDDTKSVPLTMWVKGFLLKDSLLGEMVEIETYIGRKVKGQLVEVNPAYRHSYGSCVPELLYIGRQVRSILYGGGSQ